MRALLHLPSYALTALALALPNAVLAAEPEEVPLYQTFDDWAVGCDNTRQCTALAAEEQSEGGALIVQVTREAGANGALQVTLAANVDPTGAPQLDGQPINSALQKNSEGQFQASGANALAWLGEVRNGTRLSMPVADGPVSASLHGMSAALLLMDSVQGRVGTTGALAKKGERAEKSVPAAVAAPKLAPFPKTQAMADDEAQKLGGLVIKATQQEWNQELEEQQPPEANVYALDSKTALVLIRTSCGAYNCSYALYQTPRALPVKPRPPTIQPLPWQGSDTEVSGSVSYDPLTGVLESFDKGRGIGDCGTHQTWRFNGKAFELRSMEMMATCSGTPSQYWPTMWRSRE